MKNHTSIPEALRKLRHLNFPADASLGWLDVRNSMGQNEFSCENSAGIDRSGPSWHRLGQARSTVTIPPGMAVRLRLNQGAAADLSPLSHFGQDDIQVLDCSTRPVTDAQLVYLAGFSGLQSLNLWNTHVSGTGMQHLQPLQSLRCLAFVPALQPFNPVSQPEPGDNDLSFLQGLHNLTRLYLSARRLAGTGLKHLQNLSRLRRLHLVNMSVFSTEGWHTLGRLRPLWTLDLGGSFTSDDDLRYLSELAHIQDLNLSHTRLAGRGLAHLGSLLSLRSLVLDWNHIQEKELRHLTSLSRLETLSFSENQIGEEGLTFIARLPNLRKLNLSAYGTGLYASINLHGFHMLGRIKTLRSLDLSGSDIDQDGLASLSTLNGLVKLGLENTGVTDSASEALAALVRLRSLNLRGTDLSDDGLVRLKDLAALRELQLADTLVTGTSLVSLRRFKKLRILSLGGRIAFLPSSLVEFENLKELAELSLYGEGINDEACHHLSLLRGLRKLSFYFSQISSVGLAELKGLSGLESLVIYQAPVSDAGLSSLAQLPLLAELDIRETRVSDAGIDHLKALQGLEKLYLHNTQITPQGIAELRAALPNCTFDS